MAGDAKTIRWRQGFRGGIEALLWPYRNELEFGEEFPLGKEALRVDLLVLKKAPDVVTMRSAGCSVCTTFWSTSRRRIR